jgi:arylformamidase
VAKSYDLTLPVSTRLPTWPGDPAFRMEPISSTASGAEFNVLMLHMGCHTGTHVDAPRHVAGDGPAIDVLPLDTLIGDAWVCRFGPAVRAITAVDLDGAAIPASTSRLLLATSNSSLWDSTDWEFVPEYVALAPDGAEWILSHGIRLVGIDYLSIGADGPDGLRVHRMLLETGVVVVEGLDLRQLPTGSCRLLCLPLRIEDADGSPARVIAVR